MYICNLNRYKQKSSDLIAYLGIILIDSSSCSLFKDKKNECHCFIKGFSS